jgi:D-beta-D-heptose 7-phosphate kinase/D-beta-D-heptose 1-phosphate adenosyltransferase
MLKDKIKNLRSLKVIIKKLQNKGKKIVFSNGCFDILHYGHVRYLEEAKKKGDILVVGINSDKSVKKLKGPKRPLVKQKDRLSLVAALESVDYVLLFKETSPLNVIKALRPDVLVKGADWNKPNIVGASFILSYGGKVYTIKLIQGRSTTNLINNIAQKY